MEQIHWPLKLNSVLAGETSLRGMFGHGMLESDIDFYDSFPFASRNSPVHFYPQGLQKSPVEIAQRRRFLTDGQAPFTGKSTCKLCADIVPFFLLLYQLYYHNILSK